MGKQGRPRHEGGRSGGGTEGRKKDRGGGGGSGGGGGDEGGEEYDGMRLIEMARLIRKVIADRYEKGGHASQAHQKGAMVSIERFGARFSYNGRAVVITMPWILLQNTGRSFQVGYIYGALVRAIKPKMQECPDCGKIYEPLYDMLSDGTIYKVKGNVHY